MTKSVILALAFLLIPPASFAATASFFLNAREADSLKESARAHYAEGAALMDRIAPELALRAFDAAAARDTAHAPIRLLVARVAIYLADSRTGHEADELYALAVRRLEEIGQRDLGIEPETARAAALLDEAREKRDRRPQRDAAIAEAGKRYLDRRIEEIRAGGDKPDALDRIVARRREQAEFDRQRRDWAARHRYLTDRSYYSGRYDFYDNGLGYGYNRYDSRYEGYIPLRDRYDSWPSADPRRRLPYF